MRAKPEMEPWVHTDKSNIELRRSGTITRAFVLRLGSAAPTELKKCVETNNPGLAPWAVQEYRPVGAFRRPQLKQCQYVALIFVITRTCLSKHTCTY